MKPKLLFLLLLTIFVSCDKTKSKGQTNSALVALLSAFNQPGQNSTQVAATNGAAIPVAGTPLGSAPTPSTPGASGPDPLLRVNLTIPAGALDEDTTITYDSIPLPAAKDGVVPFQAAYSFGPEGTQFNTPANLEICYNPQELINKNLSERTVQIQYYDPDTQSFVSMGGEVDTQRHCVTSSIYHFSSYILAAQALALSGNLAPVVGGAAFFPALPIAGLPVTVRSNITDFDTNGSSVAGTNIFYRRVGDPSYKKLKLNVDFSDPSGQFYIAQIPAADVTTAGIQYYIEAVDSLGAVTTQTPTTRTVQAPRNPPASPIRFNATVTRMTAGFSRNLTVQVRGINNTWYPVPASSFGFISGFAQRIGLTTLQYTATVVGVGTMQATFGSASVQQSPVIQAGPLSYIRILQNNVDVTWQSIDVTSGSNTQFDAQGLDQFGNFVSTLPTFTTTGGIGTMGTGANIGLFTAVSPLNFLSGSVVASVGDISNFVNINVQPFPTVLYPSSPYSLTGGFPITAIQPVVNGGPLQSCVTFPALPQGLSIDGSTCAITGAPTAATALASYTVRATNIYGNVGFTSVQIEVTAPPVISVSARFFSSNLRYVPPGFLDFTFGYGNQWIYVNICSAQPWDCFRYEFASTDGGRFNNGTIVPLNSSNFPNQYIGPTQLTTGKLYVIYIAVRRFEAIGTVPILQPNLYSCSVVSNDGTTFQDDPTNSMYLSGEPNADGTTPQFFIPIGGPYKTFTAPSNNIILDVTCNLN